MKNISKTLSLMLFFICINCDLAQAQRCRAVLRFLSEKFYFDVRSLPTTASSPVKLPWLANSTIDQQLVLSLAQRSHTGIVKALRNKLDIEVVILFDDPTAQLAQWEKWNTPFGLTKRRAQLRDYYGHHMLTTSAPNMGEAKSPIGLYIGRYYPLFQGTDLVIGYEQRLLGTKPIIVVSAQASRVALLHESLHHLISLDFTGDNPGDIAQIPRIKALLGIFDNVVSGLSADSSQAIYENFMGVMRQEYNMLQAFYLEELAINNYILANRSKFLLSQKELNVILACFKRDLDSYEASLVKLDGLIDLSHSQLGGKPNGLLQGLKADIAAARRKRVENSEGLFSEAGAFRGFD